MSNLKFTEIDKAVREKKGVVSLATRPNRPAQYGEGSLSAEALKQRFDDLALAVIEKYNELVAIMGGKTILEYFQLPAEIKVDNISGQTLAALLKKIITNDGKVRATDPTGTANISPDLDSVLAALYASFSEVESNEEERKAYENQRREDENTRESNEETRQSNELNRKSVWIKYSAYSDGTDATDEWSLGKNFIGVATSHDVPRSNSEYKWCIFRGEKGAKGDKGDKGDKGATGDAGIIPYDVQEFILWVLGTNGSHGLSYVLDEVNGKANCTGIGWVTGIDGDTVEIGSKAYGLPVVYVGGFARSDVKHFIIPDSVMRIGNSAFRYCHRLRSVVIGKGVAVIEKNAFDDCDRLTDIYYRGTEEEWQQIDISTVFSDSVTIHYDYYGG